jgi:hypothetical protein
MKRGGVLLPSQPQPRETNMTIQKLTKEFLLSRIADTRYVHHEGTTLTHCLLKMKNGIVVDGKSACLNPADFDTEMGRKIAYDYAFAKLWELEGYARASEHEQALQELKSIRRDIAELRKAHPFKPEIRIVNNPGRTLSEVAYIDVLGMRIPVGDGFTVGVVTPTAARALDMQRQFLNAAALQGVSAKADVYSRLVELVNGCTVRFLPGPYTVHRMGGMDFSHIVGDLDSVTDAERQFLVSRIRLAPGSVNGLDDFLRNAVKRKPALNLSAVAGTEGGAQ